MWKFVVTIIILQKVYRYLFIIVLYCCYEFSTPQDNFLTLKGNEKQCIQNFFYVLPVFTFKKI